MNEAEELLNELGLDEDSPILEFLKLVSEGKATILNLTEDILKWIRDESLVGKMQIRLWEI